MAVGVSGRPICWPSRRPGAFRVDFIPSAQGAPGAVRIFLHSVIQSGFRDPSGDRTRDFDFSASRVQASSFVLLVGIDLQAL